MQCLWITISALDVLGHMERRIVSGQSDLVISVGRWDIDVLSVLVRNSHRSSIMVVNKEATMCLSAMSQSQRIF